MENLDIINYDATLASEVPGMLMAGGILTLSAFLVMFIIIKKRWKSHVLPFFLGLATFSIVRIFVMLTESILMLVPSIDMAFEYNPNALVIVDCILAMFGYMAARLVVANMAIGRFGSQGDVMIAGLGLGFGDALLFGITVISNYVWCIAIDNGGLISAFEGMSEADALLTYQSLADLLYGPSYLWLALGLSAVIDMALHIVLTMVVYGIARRQVIGAWHMYSGIIYLVVILPMQLYSYEGVLICMLIKIALMAAAMWYVSKKVLNKVEYEED